MGEEQCYDLGKQLRERYLPASNSAEYTTTIEGLTLWYDADRVQVSYKGKIVVPYSLIYDRYHSPPPRST